jgi:predicted ATPase/class 3 adenylate cyclase
VRAELPTGTVTFLFTDIEGSTALLQELGDEAFAGALAEHRQILRDAFAAHGGVEVDTQGDAFFCVFASARDAVACAEDAQARLAATRVRVRMGLHSGEALVADGHYVGLDVHRAARVGASGHGGQVVVSPTTAALIEPGTFPLRDLGEHRLKDLSAPVRLHQLGDAAFPPLKTLHRTNLPVPATPFLGRRRELEAVLRLAQSDATRLVTLTGPGGTGKTRLALQAAAELAEAFPGGVFWVPLASLLDSALVPSAVANALGVVEERDADVARSIATALTGPTLLLVDNCEHVLDGVARILAPLLAATDRLQVIATSREPLSLAGEHVSPVDPLGRADAVDLFLARATAAGATDLDEAAVADLCARLDDLPLAIELAAARAPVLPPAVLLERLADRLELLKGTRDADERQRTLKAAIAWSYDLLSSDERRLFRRFAVFVGGATLPAVEAVTEGDVDDIASLTAKSLVRMMSTPRGPRYWLLETIREFADEQLDGADREDAERRHVEWFARLARDAGPHLDEPDAPAWLERLDADVDNLRVALAHALRADDGKAAALGAALGELHGVRGRFTEAQETLTAVLDRPTDPVEKAKLLRLLGGVLVRRGLLDAASTAFATGEELLGPAARRDADRWNEWLHLKLYEATLHYWAADSAALHAAVERLAAFIEERGTPRQRSHLLGVQTLDALRRERYVLSAETVEVARAYYDVASEAGEWDGAFQLGFVLLWRGELDEAAERFREGREVARSVGDALFELRCLLYEAIVHRKLGDTERVRALDAEIASLDDTFGYAGLVAANRTWLAQREGNFASTDEWGAAALADWKSIGRSGPTVFQWTARFPLLAADVERGRLESAAEHARAMLDASQQPLPADVGAALERALAAGTPAAFRAAVEQARAGGYA